MLEGPFEASRNHMRPKDLVPRAWGQGGLGAWPWCTLSRVNHVEVPGSILRGGSFFHIGPKLEIRSLDQDSVGSMVKL